MENRNFSYFWLTLKSEQINHLVGIDRNVTHWRLVYLKVADHNTEKLWQALNGRYS